MPFTSKQKREHRQKHTEQYRAVRLKKIRTDTAAYLLAETRKRAKRKGMECTLSLRHIAKCYATGRCQVTGIPFDIVGGGGRGNTKPFIPTIDRIDSTLGYTDANCHMVCWIYNRCKGNWTRREVLKMATALIRHEKKRSKR